MTGRHFTILAVMLLTLSGCAEDKAAGDKAAAAVKTAATTPPKDPAAANGKGKTTTKGQPEEEPAPVLSVPEGFRYEPQGRRDPFVNPVPKAATATPDVPVVRPDGLPGVLVADARIAGIVSSREPGMTKAIINAPGRKTYFAAKGEVLFDGVIKEIRPDEVVFTMVSPSTKQPVNREMVVRTGTSAGTTAGEKK